MAFQIDEKLMATNRAIITRNKAYADLEKLLHRNSVIGPYKPF